MALSDRWGMPARARTSLWSRLLSAAAVVALGIVIGAQYMAPDKHMLAVAAAVVLAGLAWRVDTLTGLGFLILAIPYPRGTVFGSTNLAFVLLLLILWLLRVTQRRSPLPASTPADGAIAGLVLAYAVSFYNVTDALSLNYALQNAELFLATVFLFYMVVSNVRTADDLRRLQTFQVISLVTIGLLAIFELNHPGGAFIPGWIEFTATQGTEFGTKNVRVGGPFFDFELLSEFSAISSLLLAFLILRARSVAQRAILSGILLLDLFMLFATVTRGAIIALSLGLLYLLFRIRRRLRVVPLTLAVASIAALAGLMNFYVAHFTRSGDVGARLRETRFIGVVPDSRLGAWTSGWQRYLEHPLIGHGPYYSPQTGTHTWFWPHNVYLYIANIVGAVGLAFFLILLIRMFQLSSRGSDDLMDPDYARAFLLIANVQLVVFAIDQVKIDYLRNPVYQFEVWLMFAMLISAYRITHPAPGPAAAAEPEPAAA